MVPLALEYRVFPRRTFGSVPEAFRLISNNLMIYEKNRALGVGPTCHWDDICWKF